MYSTTTLRTPVPMTEMEHYQALGISLGLGLLVGLQRQWKDADIAGIRTFSLMTLTGTLSVIASGGIIGALSVAGLIGLTLLLVIANLAKINDGQHEAGMTTEVGAMLMYHRGLRGAGTLRAGGGDRRCCRGAVALEGVAAQLRRLAHRQRSAGRDESGAHPRFHPAAAA
ncbi:MAG: MgtC/SapB family protein [Planctomycetaceae bacterium]